jgi:hypothetical protein
MLTKMRLKLCFSLFFYIGLPNAYADINQESLFACMAKTLKTAPDNIPEPVTGGVLVSILFRSISVDIFDVKDKPSVWHASASKNLSKREIGFPLGNESGVGEFLLANFPTKIDPKTTRLWVFNNHMQCSEVAASLEEYRCSSQIKNRGILWKRTPLLLLISWHSPLA